MQANVRYAANKLKASFWLIPGLMVISSLVLAFATTNLERGVLGGIDRWLPLYRGGPEGARLFLSTIAGSMITVTSLVFSLTLVALSLASSQLGPRLITIFMSDRITQLVLGTFVSTFVFALMVLRSIVEVGPEPFLPRLSVSLTLVMALFSFGWLIFFIHHLAQTLQADAILGRISGELSRWLHRDDVMDWQVAPEHDADDDGACSIFTETTGYFQAIDYGGLLAACIEAGGRLHLSHRPGHFVVAGQAIGSIAGPVSACERLRRECPSHMVIGPHRTDTQDPEYSLAAMVEVGVRALSPGINDFRTAISSVDQVAKILAVAMDGGLAAGPVLRDKSGAVRVTASVVDFAGLADASLNLLRQHGADQVAIIVRLFETLSSLAELCRTEDHRRVLARHLERLCHAVEVNTYAPGDLLDINREIKRAEMAIAGVTAPTP